MFKVGDKVVPLDEIPRICFTVEATNYFGNRQEIKLFGLSHWYDSRLFKKNEPAPEPESKVTTLQDAKKAKKRLEEYIQAAIQEKLALFQYNYPEVKLENLEVNVQKVVRLGKPDCLLVESVKIQAEL